MSDAIAIGWYGPTHDYWGWMLGHFRDVTLLTDRNVNAWIAAQSASTHGEANSPAAFLIASDSRFDSQIEFARHFEQTVAPKQPNAMQLAWCALLGDDWVGYRRTQPLPETMQTFYWYELYDRVFPWLKSTSRSADSAVTSDADTSGTRRRISPRVQRCIESSMAIEGRLQQIAARSSSMELALVITETTTTRQLWNDALTEQGVKCFSTTPDNLDVWANPDLIVVDLESEPLAVRKSIDRAGSSNAREDLIHRLSLQFPEAIILTTEGFPRWETWNSLRESGADLIVAKPFQMTGIFDTLENVSKH